MKEITPGEWETSRDAVPEGVVQITVYAVDTGVRVATVFDSEANAPLIKSAPALLEACEQAEHWLSEMKPGETVEPKEMLRVLRTVILRAKGN